MDEGMMLLLIGAVLSASLVVALGAARTGLPVLVAFLGLGMLLGSDGPGGVGFDDAKLAREVGVVGLALILFEGGLQTSWRRLREVAVPAALLSTVGVVVSTLLTGLAAHALFDLSWLASILLGAVVSSTDAAAVFATLRFTHLRRRVARTLEAESGGNDPMAVALTVGLIAWIERPDSYGFADLALLVVRQIGLGLVVGVVLGVAASWVFARLPHSIGAFAPVASIAAAALSFGAADVLVAADFWPSTWWDSPSAEHPRVIGDSSSRSTKDLPSWRRSHCSSCSACSSSHANWPTSPSPAWYSRCYSSS